MLFLSRQSLERLLLISLRRRSLSSYLTPRRSLSSYLTFVQTICLIRLAHSSVRFGVVLILFSQPTEGVDSVGSCQYCRQKPLLSPSLAELLRAKQVVLAVVYKLFFIISPSRPRELIRSEVFNIVVKNSPLVVWLCSYLTFVRTICLIRLAHSSVRFGVV